MTCLKIHALLANYFPNLASPSGWREDRALAIACSSHAASRQRLAGRRGLPGQIGLTLIGLTRNSFSNANAESAMHPGKSDEGAVERTEIAALDRLSVKPDRAGSPSRTLAEGVVYGRQ